MLSEAEAAVAEEGMLTPAAAAAATSADPANVAAMDFAASDTAPALGTAAAVPEAEAFAGTKATTDSSPAVRLHWPHPSTGHDKAPRGRRRDARPADPLPSPGH